MITKSQHKSFFILLCILNILLFTVVGVLSLKIKKRIQNGNVKGVQYETRIDKNTLVFDPNSTLKYFYEPKPNSTQVWNPDWLGYTVTNKINADGLNESKDYSIEKPPRTYRIITLGDSFTYGLFVNTSDNYPKQLEFKLNHQLRCPNIDNFEVLNLGVVGYDIAYDVERFRVRGKKYQSDLILWLLSGVEINKINELTIPITNKIVAEGIPAYDSQKKTTPLYDEQVKRLREKVSEKEIFEYQTKVLTSLNLFYQGDVFIATFSTYPKEYIKYITDIKEKWPQIHFLNNLTNIFVQDDLHFLDHHPNQKGYQLMTEDIFYDLAKNIFSTCQVTKN